MPAIRASACCTILALVVALSGLWPGISHAGEARAEVQAANPFFALCIGTHDAKKRTPAEQAAMLEELGYDGMAHLWLKGLEERIRTLDEHGLKLFQVYLRVNLDPAKPKYDPSLPEAIKLLKGRGTILGLLVQGVPPSPPVADDRAVAILREIGEMAAGSGVRVALYPHTGDYVERVEDAVRLAKKVDRPNVGVMFNLCHCLKVDGPENIAARLEAAAPHLMVVTINGADLDGENWDQLIQTLDRGTFDVGRFVKTLHDLGYTGPIGLQCYGVKGDKYENLKRSMGAWRDIRARIAANQQ